MKKESQTHLNELLAAEEKRLGINLNDDFVLLDNLNGPVRVIKASDKVAFAEACFETTKHITRQVSVRKEPSLFQNALKLMKQAASFVNGTRLNNKTRNQNHKLN